VTGPFFVGNAGKYWVKPDLKGDEELESSSAYRAGRLPTVNLGNLNPSVREDTMGDQELGFICHTEMVSPTELVIDPDLIIEPEIDGGEVKGRVNIQPQQFSEQARPFVIAPEVIIQPKVVIEPEVVISPRITVGEAFATPNIKKEAATEEEEDEDEEDFDFFGVDDVQKEPIKKVLILLTTLTSSPSFIRTA
jgi:hypothetical protein